jgi:hypothetical protein
MAEITLTLRDTPAGGVSIQSSFKPAVGSSCTPAQAQALDLHRLVVKAWPAGAAVPHRLNIKANDPGPGDDVKCVACGARALDTGLECSECGHDNWEAVTGTPFTAPFPQNEGGAA